MTYSGRSYEALVDEGKATALAESKYQWKLGDLAVEVVGPAGADEAKGIDVGLKEFAEDIGVEYQRLASYRQVSTAWPESTRVDSVPWVNYRTVYRDPAREETMASFIGKCQTTGDKPSYRNFQRHLGKQVTREYTMANAQETAEQALDDLEPERQAQVVAPIVAQPPVARRVIRNRTVREAIENAQKVDEPERERILRDLPQLPPPEALPPGGLLNMEAHLNYIRFHLRAIYDSRLSLTNSDRPAVAASIRMIVQQATVLADVIEHPEQTVVTDQALHDLLQGPPP